MNTKSFTAKTPRRQERQSFVWTKKIKSFDAKPQRSQRKPTFCSSQTKSKTKLNRQGRQGNQLIIKIKPNNTEPRMKTNLLFRPNKIKSFDAKPQRSQRKATFCSSQIKSEALTQRRRDAKEVKILFKQIHKKKRQKQDRVD